MNPQEFVWRMLRNGNKTVLIEMLRRFKSRLMAAKTTEHKTAYNFADLFLISVMGELYRFPQDGSLDDNAILSTWRTLALFGIERDAIDDYLEQNGGSV